MNELKCTNEQGIPYLAACYRYLSDLSVLEYRYRYSSTPVAAIIDIFYIFLYDVIEYQVNQGNPKST